MQKKKLLVLSSTYPRWRDDAEPGFVHELSRRLLHEFDVCVVCPHAPGSVTEELMDGVRVIRYRYAPLCLETLVNDGGIINNLKSRAWKWLLVPSFVCGQLWRTWHELRHWRPDVVHAHWLVPQGLVAALLCRWSPFLLTAHGADVFALRGTLLNRLKRFALQRSDAVTVVSRALRQELLKTGVCPGKVVVLSMGVDLSARFSIDEKVPRSRNEILFVGRFVEKKGLRYLLQSMPAILAKSPDAKLVIAGFGPEEARYRQMVCDLDISSHVEFLGPVRQEDLPALYRRAAVLAAPFVEAASGDQDGLGLVLVEALGCGCRVIVSDLPAARDVTEGMSGVYTVSTSRLDRLDNVVCDALRDEPLSETQALENVALLRERFDWSAITAAYAERLGDLARGRE